MKNNLSLIQPLKYENIFSSYHSSSNINRYNNNKLPKISLLSSHKSKEQSSSTFCRNILNIKIIPTDINSFNNININEKNKLLYPLLYKSSNNELNNNKINGQIISNSFFHLYKAKYEKIKIPKNININKSSNNHKINFIYLNLFKSPKKDNNNNVFNIDNFYNEIDNAHFKDTIDYEKEILAGKLKEINYKSIVKFKNIFKDTDFGKLNNDLININNNISKGIIDKFIENILNKNKIKKNINDNIIRNNDTSNITGEKSLIITNNAFLDWILDNVRRKIELRNQFNQHLTTIWVKNLIDSEINELQTRFGEFRKPKKFPSYSEYLKSSSKSYLSNEKSFKKNNISNITASTFRSHFDNFGNSYFKSCLNNSKTNLNNNIINENQKFLLSKNISSLNDFPFF